MTQEMQFKKIIAQYCDVKPEEMTNDMKFREDLGFSSLDFMSFLGEIEDTFDIELEEDDALHVFTIVEALDLLELTAGNCIIREYKYMIAVSMCGGIIRYVNS